MTTSIDPGGAGRFATLTFERQMAAPPSTLWQAWTAPAARAVWAAPTPTVTVEFLEVDTRVGGREISLCKVAGQPDIRCEVGWLELRPAARSVNYEVISSEGVTQSAALVTAELSGTNDNSRLVVTVALQTQFVNSGRGVLTGHGKVVGGGKSLAFCEGRIEDEQGDLVAKASAVFKYVADA